MPTKLLKEVADYCWSNSFLDIFRNFFSKHGELFEGAPSYLSGGEHNLQYWNLFQEYLKLYEETLEVYLKRENVPLDEFYQEVRDEQNKTEDPYIQVFIDCLLASTDYESFYKVMAKEGNKSLTIKNLKKKSFSPSASSDAKADAKETYPDTKGGVSGPPAERLQYDEKRYDDYDSDVKKTYK